MADNLLSTTYLLIHLFSPCLLQESGQWAEKSAENELVIHLTQQQTTSCWKKQAATAAV